MGELCGIEDDWPITLKTARLIDLLITYFFSSTGDAHILWKSLVAFSVRNPNC